LKKLNIIGLQNKYLGELNINQKNFELENISGKILSISLFIHIILN